MEQIENKTEESRLFEYYKQLLEESKKNGSLEKNFLEKNLLIIDHLNLIK